MEIKASKKLLAAILTIWGASAFADTCWTLTSGEKFYGEPVSQDAKNCVIKTRYGVLTFPNSEIAQVAVNTPPPSAAAQKPEESAKLAAGKIGSEKDSQKSKVDSAQMPSLAQSLSGEPEQYLINADSWTGDYKDFIREYFPEGWMFNISFGYSATNGATNRDTISTAAKIKKEWDVFSFEFAAYYEYAKDTYDYIDSSLNVAQRTRLSIDKYGVNAALKYKFLGSKSDWFLIYAPDYRVDVIKGLYPQIDNMFGIGYELPYLKEYGINFDLSVGVGPKYTYISSVYTKIGSFQIDDDFIMPALYVRQNFTWNLHKTLAIEQSLRYSPDIKGLFDSDDLNMNDPFSSTGWMEYYSLYFSIGLVYKPTDIFNIFVRYIYDFDKLGVKGGYDTESRFIVGIDLPLGWKK